MVLAIVIGAGAGGGIGGVLRGSTGVSIGISMGLLLSSAATVGAASAADANSSIGKVIADKFTYLFIIFCIIVILQNCNIEILKE